MNIHRLRPITTAVGLALTAVGLGLIAGCGDDTGIDMRYPVSGTVNYNGKPLEKGQISFIPVDPTGKQRPANGTIVDGHYTLSTATAGDGAMPGKYKVAIVSIQLRPEDEARIKQTMEKFGGSARQQDTAKAAARAKSLIPAKYESSEMSGLEATVEPKSNTFPFELKD